MFPLFLYPEHWEFAKRKLQPLFGFMCTLDPMGYTTTQYVVLPFLVLMTAFKQATEQEEEVHKVNLGLI